MVEFLTVISAIYLVFVTSIGLSATYQAFLVLFIILNFLVFTGFSTLKRKSIDHGPLLKNDDLKCSLSHKYLIDSTAYFFIVLFFSLIYWLGNYPGGFNLDAYGQWLQAHNLMQYNNWHPFVSTLLIQLILRVSDSFAFYIAVQIIAFSAAVSYLLYGIQRQGVNQKALIAVAFYVGVNPAIGLNTICMTKDVHFTIFLIVLAGIYIRIISTDGKWLNNAARIALFVVVCTMIALVRHNGIVFIIPTIVMLWFVYDNQREIVARACLSIIAMLIIINWPLAYLLNVQKHDNVLGEIVGVPMAMMANSFIADEDNLPTEVHGFLNEIAEDNEWKQHYVLGEWDSCKWEFGGIELLKNCKITELLYYTAVTIYNCPQACYESFKENTRMVWAPFSTSSSWMPNVYIEENEFDIRYSPISPFDDVSEFLISVFQFPLFSFIFWNYGFLFAVILVIWVLQNITNKKSSLLLLMPLFTYTVVTTLLLSGPNQRYFYFGFVLIPSTVLYLLNRGIERS